MLRLESALRKLETATAALVEIPIESLEGAQAAMDRRSLAIASLVELTGPGFTCSSGEREELLRRLRLSSEGGAEAQQKLAAVTRTALSEWRQWGQIYRALGALGEPGPILDCRA